jgi:ADP-heptose:LPS heptosyltransferase
VLAGVLAHARLFVGHDSGVTHLAAALHVPTVALFGPTDPVQWAPRGPHVFVVRGNLCTCRGSEQIRHCLERPCLPHSPEAIADVAVSALTRYQSVTKS